MKRLTVILMAGAMSAAMVTPLVAATATPAKAPAKAYTPPKTAWGAPDIQGTWTNGTLTPLQRAREYGNRLVMTPDEVKKLEGDEAAGRVEANKPSDPNLRTEDLPYECGRGFSGAGCGYNGAWIDPGSHVMRVNGEPRTSFITSTPDGRIPPRKGAGATPAGPGFGAGRGAGAPAAAPGAPARGGGGGGFARAANPETQSLAEQCLTSFGASAGPIMQPQLYNNNYEIVQSKDSVAILVEMVHDVRMVRIGGKHRTDGVRPWYGDSIGWYEGNTLVVETTNYHPRNQVSGASANLKVTERFTRVSPGRLLYQFKVEDPTVWDTSWGGEYEMGPAEGPVYEYACHEGNYALEGILSGARADEATAAAKAASATAAPAAAAR